MPQPYTKLVAEVRRFTADYSGASEVLSGDEISTATVTVSPSGLTLGSPSVDSPYVTFSVTGGTVSSTPYTITCLAVTDNGATIAAQAQIIVSTQLWS